MEVELTVTSELGEDLHALLLRTARACSETTQGAVGVLELELDPTAHASVAALSIEAEFAYQDGRRVIDGLDLRARATCADPGARDALLAEGLSRFGGTAFTNVCAALPGREGMDVTISFSSRFPVWGQQLLLLPETPSSAELAAFTDVLGALGVRAGRGSSDALVIARHTVRSPMTAEAQQRALAVSEQRGLCATLYAATLPASQAFRFETPDPATPLSVDIVLSRGLSASRVCTSADALEMSSFIQRHFGFSLGGRAYQARNCIAQARPAPDPVFKGSQRKRRSALGAWR